MYIIIINFWLILKNKIITTKAFPKIECDSAFYFKANFFDAFFITIRKAILYGLV